MFKKKIIKLSRSLLKIILPIIFKILIKLKLNRRVINFLHDRSYKSNNSHDFTKIIKNILNDNKIVALDIGAQGGFNSDNFFSNKYNSSCIQSKKCQRYYSRKKKFYSIFVHRH